MDRVPIHGVEHHHYFRISHQWWRAHLPASTGVIDVATFLRSLAKIGFDGPVRVEPFNDAVRAMAPDDAAAAAMSSLKKAFALT